MSCEWFICRRYLIPSDRRSLTYLLNVLGVTAIAVGVMVFIVSTAVMSGFRSELERRILGVNPHIFVNKKAQFFSNYHKVVNDLRKINGVKSANAVIHLQVLFRGSSGISGALIKGIQPAEYILDSSTINDNQRCLIGNADFEHLLKKGDPSPIILGTVLANKLGAKCGEIIYLVSVGGNKKIQFLVPFRVVGLIGTGIYQYDEALAYAHIGDVQNILNITEMINGIEIKVDRPDNAGKIANEMIKKINLTFSVSDCTLANTNLFAALKIQQVMMAIVLFLILTVAALSVSSAMTMMVMSKIEDISILKSMGISNFSITRIFVYRGLVMGLIGVLFGLFSGLLISILLSRYEFINIPGEIYFLSNLPADLNFKDAIFVVSFTMFVCFLFTLYPAYKASVLNTIDGLRRQ